MLNWATSNSSSPISQAKDLVDTVSGVMVAHDVSLWNGNDTSLSSPTTTQYMGVIGQIAAGGNTTTIGTRRRSSMGSNRR